jgi:hypothetical protein
MTPEVCTHTYLANWYSTLLNQDLNELTTSKWESLMIWDLFSRIFTWKITKNFEIMNIIYLKINTNFTKYSFKSWLSKVLYQFARYVCVQTSGVINYVVYWSAFLFLKTFITILEQNMYSSRQRSAKSSEEGGTSLVNHLHQQLWVILLLPLLVHFWLPLLYSLTFIYFSWYTIKKTPKNYRVSPLPQEVQTLHFTSC